MKWPHLFAFASAGFSFYLFQPSITPGLSSPPPPPQVEVTNLSSSRTENIATVTHAYSSVNPFNSDSTLVLLEKSGGIIHIRDWAGKIIRDNLYTMGIYPTSEPVWSRTDPHTLYFHSFNGNELRGYNVQTNRTQTLHRFNAYDTISFGQGEGDISDDGDHLTIIGDRRYGSIFTISSRHTSPAIDLTQYGIPDSFDVTPNNYAVLITSNPGGIYYFDDQMRLIRQAATFGGHSDRAQDHDGSDAVIVANSADASALPHCQNGVVKIRLVDSSQTCMGSFDWRLALHVSCNNASQNWCLISTYLPMSTMTKPPYSNALVKAYLDGSPPIKITNTGSSNASYARTPRAAMSRDGAYILFDSDMGQRNVDAYLATLVP